MSYRGRAKQFLESQNISIGDMISIKKETVKYRGMLLDRAEDADQLHIVLKMDSGYNVGIAIDGAEVELIDKGEKPEINLPPLDIQRDPEKKDVSIISTGGTVASVIDYKTGAVHPAFTADDLLRATPELLDEANISGKAIMNILSENMKPEFWVQAAQSVADEISGGADGVVVAHGTDTMHYTAAALSFILETPVPIVLTGAQRSSDRPSSDAFLNLMSSVAIAKSDIAEVTVCMHSTENDNQAHIHRGTRVRKMHTSRRDTFNSINSPPLARVKEGKVKIIDKNFHYHKRGECQLEVNDSLEEKVGFIKSYPGITTELLDYHIDKGYKGLLIEGTGLGHCPDHLIPSLQRAADEKIPVVMTSQCLYGRTNLNVYSTGRKLLTAGVIPAGDMLPEVAYVKLVWALGQTSQREEVKKIMQTNLKGEINEKSSSKYFLRDYGE
ncbi:glutamyl-tRNA(Gln) amidotransferase subunit D [Methanobacterium sp. MZ-A1]|uniref:Glutamyl-tRNA(Gln) amidotransferase subunit D n=1 Tax=Methanobacterium subterraneum TaxID=59277 RepID=A0A2H4VAD9_9EURY|nr:MULTISPECIES: Glu-tRNA(Gln) amidotransferase subunit GatD [Methanobacterium]AUB55051.1 glutamyl-tRNA(Gln) amidotransferase subunit D [Methanobacterium subterraneum]AUB57968.1 glutamyl-tRNA(Gln) amidotransferase subunit D [Methanobacterium sp. MZ-A1]AUB61102.1 glutamyl-tRNA(Gln) amidotransferase subunit D [Methanobacterium subterraneum]